MAGNRVSKALIRNLRELETRLTLRRVRGKGHIYVELRKEGEDGKRFIFFCVLCRARCYGDSSLFDHLRGKLHKGRYASAERTLFGPNPWPFNDGFLFFYDCADHGIAVKGPPNRESFFNFGSSYNGDSTRKVVDSVIGLERSGQGGPSGPDGGERNVECVGQCGGNGNSDLVIKGVLWKEKLTDLKVSFVGLGKIGAKIDNNYGVADEMVSIWCEWLGKKDLHDEDVVLVPEHDFGIVVFSCDIGLGRDVVGVPSPPLPYSLSEDDEEEEEEEEEDAQSKRKKRIKSFSDPEDISSTLSRRGGSYGATSVQDGCDVQIRCGRTKSSKASKKKLQREKRLQRIAEERVCELCQNRLLPGKDVACLLNMKTKRLACSGSNKTGAFHIFHTSCLIHWILVCDSEIWKNQLLRLEKAPEPINNGTKRRTKKSSAEKIKPIPQTTSAFCPQCHRAGIHTDEDQLEKPILIKQSQLFEYKITAMMKNKAWMEEPEILPNRSTGLRFVSHSEGPIQEKVSLQSLVHFYRAEE